MTNFFKTPLLLLSCVVMFIVVISSCKKNEDAASSKVELLSFGPTGAKHGDTLRFIGNNLDQVTEIDLTGATVDKSAFVQQSATLILIIVPQEAEQGFVTLKTSQGDIVSKTQLNLDVTVTIDSMPRKARPGDNITITGTYLNWVTRVTFANNKPVDSFVSKSMNQLVVKVPMDAQTGELIISTSGTEPVDITTDSALIVTLPSISGVNPNPVARDSNLTITGANLDLVKGVLFTGKTIPDTVFVSQSATKLVVKVPKEANKGTIQLVAYSGVMVESTESLKLVGDLPPLDDFPLPIYTDALQNGFQDWSYTTTHDFNNKENVRQGTTAIKAVYDAANGYQGLTFHNDAGVSTTGYTKLEFSVFGGAGTGGKKLNVVINGGYGSPTPVTIVEGEWTTFSLKLSDIGNPNPLKEIVLQSAGWGGTLYIDHVGLR